MSVALAGAVVFALLANPGLESESAAGEPSNAPAAEGQRLRLRSVPIEQRAPLPFETSGGLMFFRAVLRDRECWALLDSGSGRSLMDLELARSLELPLEPETAKVRTATGELETWRSADVAVRVPGQFEMQHPRLAAVDMSAVSRSSGREVQFVLGADTLSQLAVVVDPKTQTLRFGPGGSFKPPAGALRVELGSEMPQITLKIGAESVKVVVDTGFNGTVSLSPGPWSRVFPGDAHTGTAISAGGDGKVFARRTGRVKEIGIGPLLLADVVIQERPATRGDGLIGMGILGKFRFVMDMKAGGMWLFGIPAPAPAAASGSRE